MNEYYYMCAYFRSQTSLNKTALMSAFIECCVLVTSSRVSSRTRKLLPEPLRVQFPQPSGIYVRYPAAAYSQFSLSSPYYRAVTGQPLPLTNPPLLPIMEEERRNVPLQLPPLLPAFYGYRAPRVTWNQWSYPENIYSIAHSDIPFYR
eukprot:Gregarina_sp_Poly_1__4803@NODE_255_length_10547_cov_146_368416_g222_i0_p7_GENE_NODE_255_length_10547_cov_146_368416_g222_i0NODE_255_length_10547_cov_146_368416_g222_i0_p7_ORF_typecomplete_len148_score11_47_NODE_255_length_10547_cov_146_368416_g222_i066207063